MEQMAKLASRMNNSNNKENTPKNVTNKTKSPCGRKRKLNMTPPTNNKRIKLSPTIKNKVNNNEGTKYSPFTQKQCIFTESLINDLRRSKSGNHLFKLEAFPNVISVEGNIGVGKSTLLKNLEKEGYTVLQEPVNSTWFKYLPILYSDSKRWGCTFQLEVLHWFNKLRTLILPQLADESKPIIIERSPQSSFYIFCQNLYDSGMMSEWEVEIIKRTYDVVAWKPAQTIYLQIDPKVSCERIKERNRDGEHEIDYELIRDLHTKHELIWAQNKHEDIEVHTVDASQSKEKVAEDALNFIRNSRGMKTVSG
eukprot:UN06975